MLSSAVHRRLLLQIVTDKGEIVRLPAGGPLERDLVTLLQQCVLTTTIPWYERLAGRLWWRARSQDEINTAIRDSLHDAVVQALDTAVAELKRDTRYVWVKPL